MPMRTIARVKVICTRSASDRRQRGFVGVTNMDDLSLFLGVALFVGEVRCLVLLQAAIRDIVAFLPGDQHRQVWTVLRYCFRSIRRTKVMIEDKEECKSKWCAAAGVEIHITPLVPCVNAVATSRIYLKNANRSSLSYGDNRCPNLVAQASHSLVRSPLR